MAKPTMEELRGAVRGQVITRGDAEYDAARKVYNGMIDRHPGVILRAVDSADIMAALAYSSHNGRILSVRGGSHSVPGFGTNDGGVVIDLARMKGIRVDPAARTVRAQGGCTWGDVFHATYPVRPDDGGRHHLDHGNRRPHPRGRHRPSVTRASGSPSTT